MQGGSPGATARDRLIASVVRLAGEDGYPDVTLGRIIAEAGVSRAGFHAHFPTREDCLLAAIDGIEAGLLAEVRDAIRESPGEHAARSATGALVSFATREPRIARVLMLETLGGAPRLLDARDRAVAEMARRVERAYERLPPSTPVPDIAPEAVIGGVMRLLALRLGEEHQDLAPLGPDIATWLEGYSVALGSIAGVTPGRSPLRRAGHSCSTCRDGHPCRWRWAVRGSPLAPWRRTTVSGSCSQWPRLWRSVVISPRA